MARLVWTTRRRCLATGRLVSGPLRSAVGSCVLARIPVLSATTIAGYKGHYHIYKLNAESPGYLAIILLTTIDSGMGILPGLAKLVSSMMLTPY